MGGRLQSLNGEQAKIQAIRNEKMAQQTKRRKATRQADAERRASQISALNEQKARQQWAEYDARYQRYLVEYADAQRRDRERGRVVRMPREPKKPSLPRP